MGLLPHLHQHREDTMLENYTWTSYIRKQDTQHLSDEEIKQMTTELSSAVSRICFEYGIHN